MYFQVICCRSIIQSILHVTIMHVINQSLHFESICYTLNKRSTILHYTSVFFRSIPSGKPNFLIRSGVSLCTDRPLDGAVEVSGTRASLGVDSLSEGNCLCGGGGGKGSRSGDSLFESSGTGAGRGPRTLPSGGDLVTGHDWLGALWNVNSTNVWMVLPRSTLR